MAGTSDSTLQAQLKGLLDQASVDGKIPPSERKKWTSDILARGNGHLTAKGLAWAKRKLRSTDPVVTTTATAHRPPRPDDIGRILAHDFDPGPPGKPSSADWDIWRHMAQCLLWQAVVLSCGFEPTYFVTIPNGRGGVGIVPRRAEHLPLEMALRLLPPDDGRDIHARLMIALSQPSTVIKSLDHFLAPRTFEMTIGLPDFGTWAQTIWPELPKEFPRKAVALNPEELGLVRSDAPPEPAPPEPSPATASSKVAVPKSLHTKERLTLLKIIRVLATEAKLPDEPYKAASSIVTAAAALDLTISENAVADVLKAARGLVGGDSKE